jgi:P27 family predicted phage terminase small subunit
MPLVESVPRISRENPRNFEKIRLPRARILPQSPWDPAAMARHRKPAVIRKREGNPGKRPIPNEIAGRGKPRCPDHLSDDQKRCWQAVVRALPEGILTSADNQVLERMAVAWALHREAARLIREGAALVKGHDSRPTKNPALTIMRQASLEMELCGTALGLTPYARTRMQAPEAEDDDPLALLLGENGRSWMTEVSRN